MFVIILSVYICESTCLRIRQWLGTRGGLVLFCGTTTTHLISLHLTCLLHNTSHHLISQTVHHTIVKLCTSPSASVHLQVSYKSMLVTYATEYVTADVQREFIGVVEEVVAACKEVYLISLLSFRVKGNCASLRFSLEFPAYMPPLIVPDLLLGKKFSKWKHSRSSQVRGKVLLASTCCPEA